MARFCPQCGAQQDESARFCGKCGTPIPVIEPQAPINPQPEAAYTQPQENYYAQSEPQYAQPENSYIPPQPPKKSNKKTIAIIIAAIALIAAIVIALFATGVIGGKGEDDATNTPEGVVEKYWNSAKNGDAKAMVECLPSFMFEDEEEKQEMIEDLEEGFDSGDREYYQNTRFKVVEVSYLGSYELEYIKDIIENNFGVDLDDITEYKTVIVEITTEDGTDKSRVVVIKYKGEWKLFTF